MISISNKEHWLIEQTKIQNDGIAVRSKLVEISYNELLLQVKKTANHFNEFGIKKNDHIAVLSENNVEFILTLNALWFLGAIPVPLNIKLKPNELDELIKFSDCKQVIVNKQISNGLFELEIPIVDFNLESIQNCKTDIIINTYNPSNVCLMMFTSGSTGFPKCVQLTFNNLFFSAKSADLEINHYTNDLWLASLPFYHIGGFSIITRSFITGCTILLPNSLKHKDLELCIIKYKPSLISFVPTMFRSLIDSINKPWPKLKQIFLGGGPIPTDIIQISKEKKWPISIVYGSTETGSMVSICSTSNLIDNGISAGLPMEGVRIKIGESDNLNKVIIQSKSVAKSYYKADKGLSSKLQNSIYYSNDLGKVDGNGNLHILGRGDQIIISGGENISLLQINNLINKKFVELDFVSIGIKDEKWGQSYVIIIGSKHEDIEKKLKIYVKEQLPKFKRPRQIYKLDYIPRNELGKLQKKEIQKLLMIDLL